MFEQTVEKFNNITKKLHENVGISEALLEDGKDLFEYAQNIPSIQNVNTQVGAPLDATINIEVMFKDFSNVRNMLDEQTTNARGVLKIISEELRIDPTNQDLVLSYAELNKAQVECMKLYINSYKKISVFSSIFSLFALSK